MGKVNLLDCTLRDGGYINDWQFGNEAIKGTAEKLSQAGVEMFEIGFIKDEPFSNDRTVFPNIQCIEQFIQPKSPKMLYIGMIDAGNPVPIENIIPYDGKSIDAIRVIFKKGKIDFAFNYCKQIIEKGYKVFVQFVGTDSYSDEEFVQTIKKFNEINPFAMSIVDTFGTIKRKTFLRLIYLADNNMNPEIVLGYHAHNNLQQAFGNAETFVEMNLKRDICIDACVFGMGRGAGNLNIELFADFMNENYGTEYKIEPILEIMDDYLQETYNKRFWGYCLPYYLSAVNNCHPNYAVYYAEKQTLTEKSFNELLKSIPINERRVYKKENAEKYYNLYMTQYVDDHKNVKELSEKFLDKNILLLAPGMSLIKQKKEIELNIEKEKPIIVSINCFPEEFQPDFLFSSNIKRYSKLQNKNVKKIITSNVKDANEYDYVLNFSSYCMEDSEVLDNAGLVFLKFLSTIKVKKILIAGMDGYALKENYFDMALDYEFSHIEERNSLIQKYITAMSKTNNIQFITNTIYKS